MTANGTYHDDLGDKNLPKSLGVTPFVVPESFFDKQRQQILNQINLHSKSFVDLSTHVNFPENYFSSLESSILDKISEIKLKEKVSTDGFAVPKNYFNTLTDSILDKKNQKGMIDGLNPSTFEVPEDYFSELPNAIVTRIAEQKLREHITTDGFTAPDNYFEQVENSIQSAIKVQSWTEQIADTDFSVPSGYFENFESTLKNKIQLADNSHRTSPPKIISMPKRGTNWIKYAGVAATLLFVGIGSYFSLKTINSENNSSLIAQADTKVDFQEISNEEIVNYLAQVSEGEDLMHLTQLVENQSGEPLHTEDNLKEDDIEEYLKYML